MRSLPRTNTRVIHLLALPFAILLLISSGASADDWSYDFDGAEPAGWTIDHVTLPPGGTSATFIASIESDGTDNHLRMSDTTNASATGSFGAFAGTGDIFMDAAISAEINITQDTDDDLGVVPPRRSEHRSGLLWQCRFRTRQCVHHKDSGLHHGR